jgi:hypothetical protein
MRKRPSLFLAMVTLSLLVLGACSKENNRSDGNKPIVNKIPETDNPKAKPDDEPVTRTDSIMDRSVNFSTPEDIERSFNSIEEEAGAAVAGQIKNAIDYMLVYDLSVKRDKARLYKKLDGKTPNQILAMANK